MTNAGGQPSSNDSAGSGQGVQRPSYIGIHTRDSSLRVLYITSGVEAALGYPPEAIINNSAGDFLTDQFDVADLSWIYGSKGDGEDETDVASAYAMYFNINAADGTPVLHRMTTFKCDNCVVYIAITSPERPHYGRTGLEVQLLDQGMKQLVVSQKRREYQAAAAHGYRQASQQASMYRAQGAQVKAAFVLERLDAVETDTDEHGTRVAGARVVFVTGSVSRLIDADTSDLHQVPFMKLVAPEDLLHVGRFFDRLAETTDVLFETFSLLSRPPVVEGDVAVDDNENTRVVVECVGAGSRDGAALLLAKLRTMPPPKRDSMGNYIHSRVHEVSDEAGYISLSELISSDPDSSDVPAAWAQLR
ncbi:hypothetical protein IWQ57_001172 [Coemansia nantahalensis]|uniref:Uncharacterized protein n=1 Tax=Coemansia nantahalensis TaxID=2789366 RepID=A0ACC1K5K4_9FUNG|nr:hypothetical protein IWQ57_001172 [Coemansia nantahalensis]